MFLSLFFSHSVCVPVCLFFFSLFLLLGWLYLCPMLQLSLYAQRTDALAFVLSLFFSLSLSLSHSHSDKLNAHADDNTRT